MSRPREFDPGEVLSESMQVFWEQGYEATSIADLTDATGLSRSSLYQAFDSKRGLFDRVIEHYLEGLGAMLSPLEQGDPGIDGVLGFFDNWQQRLDLPDVDGSLGCLIVNSTAEMAGRDDDLLAVSMSYQDRLFEGFRTALDRAGNRGEVLAGSADERARMLTAGVMGVFIASRGKADEEAIGEWIHSIRSQVETWRH